ncbi:hypothetical protein K1719_043777 [Acacia pycnantha]|nr:hypothetical protein K1719_043777 [Acacia pycnantha]
MLPLRHVLFVLQQLSFSLSVVISPSFSSELLPCCSRVSPFLLFWKQKMATWSKNNAKVNFLLLFGKHIISVHAHGVMFIWAFNGIDQNLAPFEHMKLDDKFIVGCKIHPDTYLNKTDGLFTTFDMMKS